MGRLVCHLVLPAFAPAGLVVLYFTPTTVVGCTTRGLLALAVALAAAVGAFIAIGLGLRARVRRDPSSTWWIVTAAVLTLPTALLAGPLG